MKKLFGTDGVRGAAGEFPLDEKTIRIIGYSLARQFTEKLGRAPRFVTGRDTRESGEWIEKAVHDGARAGGARCESAGTITTPGVAFVTREFDLDAGVVVSASHNPFEDNGIKIFLPTGKKIDEQIERAIEKDIFDVAIPGLVGELDVDLSRSDEFQARYLEHLTGQFDDLALNDLKIVVDCANGAASHLAPVLFERLGADVISINCAPDGRNINKDCGSLHLEHLQARVLQENADLGVGFDGDADRALFVDEKGNLVDGDATLWILAQYLDSHGQLKHSTVVATVMSNLGLELALRSKGIELLRTAVGDKYVLQELIRTGSAVGGEQSGHIILPGKSLVGDGMMTALFLLEAMYEKRKKLSEMTGGFTRYPQVLVNVRVGKKLPFDDVKEISEASRRLENELDGTGRLLLRYSGTENLARVMIEGQDQRQIETQANALADVIRTSLS
jgi:phosphoglucosamine mutase